jgi:hypothetical protein
VYRLTFQGQPTIRPTELQVSVRIPKGAQVTETSPGMGVRGGRVEWEGPAEDVMRFEVSFDDGTSPVGWGAGEGPSS